MKKHYLAALIGLFLNYPISAQLLYQSDVDTEKLDEISVTTSENQSGASILESRKISDQVIEREKLKLKSSTLGNALASELGVHSNPFGGGASKPIIRGQDGVRVKILQNGTDVIDMSALSPDHVVAADTLLASKVELVRGASTLLYSIASPAGVVNVVDGRIPSQKTAGLVNENIEGEVLIRYNSGSREKVATAGVSFALTDNIVARIEGLKRNAKDYKVPEFQSDITLDYLPDSDNKSTVGTFGLSYIGEKGFIGASISQRRDRYGIPGHNHHYDSCKAHFISAIDNPERAIYGRYYLNPYPHLMDDNDIVDNPHFDGCGSGHSHAVSDPSSEKPFGYDHKHNHRGPWVDMKMTRYDLRGEINNPIYGLEKAKLSLTYADYYHDERDPGNPEREKNTMADGKTSMDDYGHAAAIFQNKGFNGRLEFYHSPISFFNAELKGMLGTQYQTQKSSAITPYLPSFGATSAADPRHLLVPHTNKSFSVFGLERLKVNNFTFESAVRWEYQKTPIEYNHSRLNDYLKRYEEYAAATPGKEAKHPNLSPYKEKAISYSTALLWDFAPQHQLNLTYSHNERLPAPMELYYSGKHLATNSFEYGNKNLRKERSDNFELGFSYQGEKLEYKTSAYYSEFDNYIFNENIVKFGNLYIRRYNQTTAKFYGLEGEITFHLTPEHNFTLFGDVVRGKIGALSPVKGKLIASNVKYIYNDDAENMKVDEFGDIVPPVIFGRGGFRPNPEYVTAESCTSKSIDDWLDENPDTECLMEVNVYKNGTTTPSEEDYDVLERKATISPRLPPMRLGFRYSGAFGEHWLLNIEYSRVFKQERVSSSTIAIKPTCYVEDPENDGAEMCQPKNNEDGDLKARPYYAERNPYTMQPRIITENVTKGYNLLNVGLDYNRVIKGIDYTVSLRADNLLNEKIYIHNSFLPFVPQMGRNYTLALSVKF